MKTYQSVYKLKDVCGDIIDGDENIMKQIIAGYGPMIAYIRKLSVAPPHSNLKLQSFRN